QGHDWDPTDGDPEGTYDDRARVKAGPDGTNYTMLDDTKLCMHAGLCGTARQTVWQMMPDTADSEVRGTVVRMVEKCPSGRLTNVIDGQVVEQALPQEVNVVPGGPLWVTGGITVTRADGTEMQTRNRVTLCRCGASDRKPLCDGSHKKIEFEGRS
ncbi:MAG: CDGSH iron-sulfur domain-containing protein, partial [Actinomycetota bacterium]